MFPYERTHALDGGSQRNGDAPALPLNDAFARVILTDQFKTHYSQASHFAADTAHLDVKLSFGTGSPSPVELQAATHIALGLLVNGTSNNDEAMSEFEQARKLAPDSAAANCGYGWKRLNPQSKTRLTDAPQAKAALQKAALADDPNIKKAAGEELSGLR